LRPPNAVSATVFPQNTNPSCPTLLERWEVRRSNFAEPMQRAGVYTNRTLGKFVRLWKRSFDMLGLCRIP
jgi:hypothetical protein